MRPRFEARITNGVPVVFDRQVYTHFRTGGRPRDPVFLNLGEAQWVANRANLALSKAKPVSQTFNADVLRARFVANRGKA